MYKLLQKVKKKIHFYALTEWIPIIVFINNSLDPPTPFFKGEEVNFDHLPRRGRHEKLKKGWEYGVDAGLVKRGAGTFPIQFFEG